MRLTRAGNREITRESRRAFLRLISAASLAGLLKSNAAPANSASAQPKILQRYYQASAVITFLGVTVFSKKDVGGGYAVAEEVRQGERTVVALQFAGGSWPSKAHGVNRLGYIHELVVERPAGDLAQADYFGFMTSSAEKSFDQARTSIADKSGKPVPYSATEGSARQGVWRFNLCRMMLSSRFTYRDLQRLTGEVRASMAADQSTVRSENRFGDAPVPNTFLNSLRQALRNPAGTAEYSLVYNGKAYRMRCAKQPEARLMRLNGTLSETGTGHNTPFKLWYEPDSPNYLPLKIEYKAKSFLKLVFEAESQGESPAPSLLLSKESA